MGGCKFPTHHSDLTVSDLLCLRVGVVAGEVSFLLPPAAALLDPVWKAATLQGFTHFSQKKWWINISIKNKCHLNAAVILNHWSQPLARWPNLAFRVIVLGPQGTTKSLQLACWYYAAHVLLDNSYKSQNAQLIVDTSMITGRSFRANIFTSVVYYCYFIFTFFISLRKRLVFNKVLLLEIQNAANYVYTIFITFS